MTNWEFRTVSIYYPTMLRVQVPITQQQCTFPSRVGFSVTSLTLSTLGRNRANRSSTRSSLVSVPLVPRALAGPEISWIPVSCISRQISHSPTPMPLP